MGQAEAQTWNADVYARNAGFVPQWGQSLVEWLAPQAGERVLDLGCGDGTLTRKLIEKGATVVGVDSSSEMVAAALALSVDARRMDAERLSFHEEFDAVLSNAALHWMRRPDAVLEGVRCALRPEGRFVGEFGGQGNVAAICVAIFAVLARRGIDGTASFPWYFPTLEEYRTKLTDHGFEVKRIETFARPTELPTGLKGWLRTFAAPLLGLLPAQERQTACAEVEELLRPVLCDRKGRWTADYVRLRFFARLGS